MQLSTIRTIEHLFEQYGLAAKQGVGESLDYPSMSAHHRMVCRSGSSTPDITDAEYKLIDATFSDMVWDEPKAYDAMGYYYVAGIKNQERVAKKMGISQPRVTELLRVGMAWMKGALKSSFEYKLD